MVGEDSDWAAAAAAPSSSSSSASEVEVEVEVEEEEEEEERMKLDEKDLVREIRGLEDHVLLLWLRRCLGAENWYWWWWSAFLILVVGTGTGTERKLVVLVISLSHALKAEKRSKRLALAYPHRSRDLPSTFLLPELPPPPLFHS